MTDQKTKFENRTTHFFDRMASRYDSHISRFYFESLYQKIVETIQEEKLVQPKMRVLDVACGTGEVVLRLARRYPESTFWGVDGSRQMITEAKNKIGDLRNISFVVSNAEEVPFDEDSFDLIISSEAFHHFWEPQEVLLVLAQKLKEEGRLLLVDPGADTFLQRLIFRYLGRIFEVHKHIYDQGELKQLLENTGFAVEKVFTYHLNNFILGKKIGA
ncbi:MAG: methyltransferase domain-containing protein [Patescibacteria group bacterium]